MKLTAGEVAAIRAARQGPDPVKLAILSRRYGVSQGYVSLIATGKRKPLSAGVKQSSLSDSPPTG